MLEDLDDDSQLEMSSRASGEPREPRRHAANEELRTNDSVAQEFLDEEESSEDNSNGFALYYRIANASFFIGSILYVWQAIWNLMYDYKWYGGNDEGNDEDAEYDDDYVEPFWSFYKVLSMIAALMYVANALVDGRVAVSEMRGKVGSGRFGDDPRWEIGVAVTFGVAALCDFLSELIATDDNEWPSYAAGCAAVDIYLLNAVLVVSGRRPQFTSLPKTLMSSGDILFMIGSIIDVTISFVNDPKVPTSRYIGLAWFSFASAALWFIDSILYILADYLSDDDDYSSIGSEDSQASRAELEIASTLTPGGSLDSVTMDDGNDSRRLKHRTRPEALDSDGKQEST